MGERQQELLYHAITQISDEYIEEAQNTVRRESLEWGRSLKTFLKITAAVAAGVFLAAVGIMTYVHLTFRAGSGDSGPNGSGVGHDGGSVFMSYAGPILPLMLLEENASITAKREITMDLTADSDCYKSLVQDQYVLENSSDEEQRIQVLYPFVASMQEINYYGLADSPTLSVNGEKQESRLYTGYASGGEHDSWEDYRELFSNDAHTKKTIAGWESLAGNRVTVYRFTNAQGPKAGKGVPNPTIHVNFDLDYDRTKVFTYNFDGVSWEETSMDLTFSIPRDGSKLKEENIPSYLIVLGDDVQNLRTEGYATGGWDTKKKIEYSVDMERYETDLDDVLREAGLFLYRWSVYGLGGEEFEAAIDFENWYGAFCDDLINSRGFFSENYSSRQQTGNLEESNFYTEKRIFYLEAEVVVPAGGGLVLTAEQFKKASFDFGCQHTENAGIMGYELLMETGVGLKCLTQHANLVKDEGIEIVRQNFGFDPEGVRSRVELDPAVERYYLEVRKIK